MPWLRDWIRRRKVPTLDDFWLMADYGPIVIANWLRRPFGPPPFDYEKAVENYLLELPRCSRKLVVASPKYDSAHYFGEVIVDTVELIPWAEHHVTECFSSVEEEQAARLALPRWLRNADPDDQSLTHLTEPFVMVLLPYKQDFVRKGIAEVTCGKCGAIAKDAHREGLDESNAGRTWKFWTDKWTCANGHVIYREDHEAHFYFGGIKE